MVNSILIDDLMKQHGEKIETIRVCLFGLCYEPVSSQSNDQLSVSFYPKSESILYYNSFMPVITITNSTTNDDVHFSVSSKFAGSIQNGMTLFSALLIVFQLFLIVYFFSGEVKFGTALFIPSIIFLFMWAMASLVKILATKKFIERFIKELKKA